MSARVFALAFLWTFSIQVSAASFQPANYCHAERIFTAIVAACLKHQPEKAPRVKQAFAQWKAEFGDVAERVRAKCLADGPKHIPFYAEAEKEASELIANWEEGIKELPSGCDQASQVMNSQKDMWTLIEHELSAKR